MTPWQVPWPGTPTGDYGTDSWGSGYGPPQEPGDRYLNRRGLAQETDGLWLIRGWGRRAKERGLSGRDSSCCHNGRGLGEEDSTVETQFPGEVSSRQGGNGCSGVSRRAVIGGEGKQIGERWTPERTPMEMDGATLRPIASPIYRSNHWGDVQEITF